MNWLSQVISVALYNLRTIPARIGASLTTAVGIAGVVLVLVGVLSIAQGVRRTLTATGTKDVAIVLRTGADTEMNSGLTRAETRLVSDAPGLARDASGAIASAELLVIINLNKRTTGTEANVPLRGIGAGGYAAHGNIQIVAGRKFETGKNEIIVGAGAARTFEGLEVGKEIKVGQHAWQVVGIFSAGGGASESEVWTDADVLQPAYNRLDSYQSVYARLESPAAFDTFKNALTSNPELKVDVVTLDDFYAAQSTQVTQFITQIGIFISSMMAFGALFAALNTMYGAVSARTREIATLRAMGFGTGPVILSVLAESVFLALAGGALGAGAAWVAFDGYQTSTMNWQTFSQVTFAFAVTPPLLLAAIIGAAALGLLGGLFPAIRAARLPIASALRDS